MRKLKDPTYKRFINGPLERFDYRNSASTASNISQEEAVQQLWTYLENEGYLQQ